MKNFKLVQHDTRELALEHAKLILELDCVAVVEGPMTALELDHGMELEKHDTSGERECWCCPERITTPHGTIIVHRQVQ